ncbi:hypothetical protein [Atopobium deltae]|uniref:Uncharacterized protein n=1 Tax=Atopobium deltae TaxID=1393034 RepID=A0A133XTZ7_9ACTN|nr:hypothetical protein [Atopobium deltae]KXB34389.1 hypothetical protein HMPREF3192_00828 [Atopobium deltae]
MDNSIFNLDELNDQQLHDYKKDKCTADALAEHGLPIKLIDNPLIKNKG